MLDTPGGPRTARQIRIASTYLLRCRSKCKGLASNILQELLTVKSDDVEGRTKIYESMVKGENTLEAGTPASFDVLTNEICGLGLHMQLIKKRI